MFLFVFFTDYPAPGVIENIDRLISLNQLSNVSAMGHVWGAENVTSLLQEAMRRITSNNVRNAASGSFTITGATLSSLSSPSSSSTITTAATSSITPATSLSSLSEEGFDVVLMAELLWKDTYIHHRALLESVVGTLKKDGVAFAAFAHRPTQVHLPPPPLTAATTTTTSQAATITAFSPPLHTSHTIANDMEFFTLAESTDFNLMCEQITSCRQYCDVGGNGEPIEVKIFTLRFR